MAFGGEVCKVYFKPDRVPGPQSSDLDGSESPSNSLFNLDSLCGLMTPKRVLVV